MTIENEFPHRKIIAVISLILSIACSPLDNPKESNIHIYSGFEWKKEGRAITHRYLEALSASSVYLNQYFDGNEWGTEPVAKKNVALTINGSRKVKNKIYEERKYIAEKLFDVIQDHLLFPGKYAQLKISIYGGEIDPELKEDYYFDFEDGVDSVDPGELNNQ